MTKKRKLRDSSISLDHNPINSLSLDSNLSIRRKSSRIRSNEQQMGFGTVRPQALSQYLLELQQQNILTTNELFLDIGKRKKSFSFSLSLSLLLSLFCSLSLFLSFSPSLTHSFLSLVGAGFGNVLEDVSSLYPVWGVEMNEKLQERTPSIWMNKIDWCKLEDVNNTSLGKTTIAYMYDLCLKRLSRRSKCLVDDPHWSIQNILLNSTLMPSLKYFISTYESGSMHSLHGNCWQLVHSKRLPCSTDSYTFYVYERKREEKNGDSEIRDCEEKRGRKKSRRKSSSQ
jgi:hypothetical protein